MTCRAAYLQNYETRLKDPNVKKIKNRKPFSFYTKTIKAKDNWLKIVWIKIKKIIWGNL